jgi:hypothetical protein
MEHIWRNKITLLLRIIYYILIIACQNVHYTVDTSVTVAGDIVAQEKSEE